jgi:methyl-accepting chemotaxis protein
MRPDFQRIKTKLLAIRGSHSDIRYVYTMGKVDGTIRFLVDPDFGNESDPGAAIGEEYEGGQGNLKQGFDGPAVDDAFTTDKWGTFLSGYAPFHDTEGKLVGIVGVDMTLVAEKQAFIGNTFYAVMGIGILLAGLFILLFSKTIIKDIHQLNHVANTISMGNMDVNVEVERKDEIGELAESFGRMVASLKIMMMTQDT